MAIVPTVMDGNRAFDIFSKMLNDRIIFLSSDVNDQVAELIVSQLLYLELQDPKADIQFYINSPGGSVTAGMAIFDTMNFVSCDVQTICVGQACSMGAFLLAAGTKGKRVSLPNSNIMIHQPLGGFSGQATDAEIRVKLILRLKETLVRNLAKFTNKKYEKVLEDCERDYWLTAPQAKEYGLVDHVVESREEAVKLLKELNQAKDQKDSKKTSKKQPKK